MFAVKCDIYQKGFIITVYALCLNQHGLQLADSAFDMGIIVSGCHETTEHHICIWTLLVVVMEYGYILWELHALYAYIILCRIGMIMHTETIPFIFNGWIIVCVSIWLHLCSHDSESDQFPSSCGQITFVRPGYTRYDSMAIKLSVLIIVLFKIFGTKQTHSSLSIKGQSGVKHHQLGTECFVHRTLWVYVRLRVYMSMSSIYVSSFVLTVVMIFGKAIINWLTKFNNHVKIIFQYLPVSRIVIYLIIDTFVTWFAM